MKRTSIIAGAALGAAIAGGVVVSRPVPPPAVTEARRQELWSKLEKRVLSDKEMAEVQRVGATINVEPMGPHSPEHDARELETALRRQEALRALRNRDVVP